jgi:hypothetical protein
MQWSECKIIILSAVLYPRETSLTLKVEDGLEIFENKVLGILDVTETV